MNKYTTDVTKIKYKKTRRGVNAIAVVTRDGSPFLTLNDEAEKIVAEVTFADPRTRDAFLADAKAAGFNTSGDAYTISEYARAIVMAAEDAYASL